jgi:hypothetical protein
VWFITGGGALFAAWPVVYATAFSGFYWAMILVLWALFFRPVGFDYRSKIHNAKWRSTWDWGLFIGGPCRRWCSASRSATCCKAYRSTSTTCWYRLTPGVSGNC